MKLERLWKKGHRKKGRGKGKISTRHKGGGSKKRYRELSREIRKGSKVMKIEYDPNRTGKIAWIKEEGTNKGRYVLAGNWELGRKIEGRKRLGELKEGTEVYDIEGKYIRGEGTYGKIIRNERGEGVIVKMPSGEEKEIGKEKKCMEGRVWGGKRERLGKAGRNRLRGKRPVVRGRAMNIVDHPLGGNTSGGKRKRTKWGKRMKK